MLSFCILFDTKNYFLIFNDIATSEALEIFVNLMIMPLERGLDSFYLW